MRTNKGGSRDRVVEVEVITRVRDAETRRVIGWPVRMSVERDGSLSPAGRTDVSHNTIVRAHRELRESAVLDGDARYTR